MKKYNFDLRLVFSAKCTVEANDRAAAAEIVENFLFTYGADLAPDVCADEGKKIIDYEVETNGTIETIYCDNGKEK